MIKIENLLYRYGNSNIDNFSLNCNVFIAEKGLLTSIIGPNASGKTTLVNLCSGKIRTCNGTININSINIEKYDKSELNNQISYFGPTDTRLLVDEMYVIDHFALAIYSANHKIPIFFRNIRISDIEKYLPEWIGKEFEEYYYVKVKHLSSGMKQLLSIAISTIGLKNIIIADETSSHLDHKNADMLFKTLKEKANENKTVIIISHDLKNVAEYSDNIYFVKNGMVSNINIQRIEKNDKMNYMSRLICNN